MHIIGVTQVPGSVAPEEVGQSKPNPTSAQTNGRRIATATTPPPRGHHSAVDAWGALNDVLGEEAAAAKFGYAQRDVAHARGQVALAVAVAAVGAAGAKLVRLDAHNRVYHVLGEAPYGNSSG